jgi:catechol 2,3-dioxygenase-like lactoylglutathione lyase family enzyme
MRVTTADHAIRRVRDLDASLGFYRDALGSEPFDLEEYRRGERPLVSLQVSENFGCGAPAQ